MYRDRTIRIEAPSWIGTSGFVTTTTSRKRAKSACEANHFSPLITQSPAVERRAARELRGIGACLRLGHRIARRDLAVDERLQVAAFLLGRAEARQDLGVARIGRLGAEHRGRKTAAAEDLVHETELELPVTLATELRAEMTGPEPLFAYELLERRHRSSWTRARGIERIRGTAEHEVERLHFVRDETVHPVEPGLEIGIGREIPCHGPPLHLPRVSLHPATSARCRESTQRRAAKLPRTAVECTATSAARMSAPLLQGRDDYNLILASRQQADYRARNAGTPPVLSLWRGNEQQGDRKPDSRGGHCDCACRSRGGAHRLWRRRRARGSGRHGAQARGEPAGCRLRDHRAERGRPRASLRYRSAEPRQCGAERRHRRHPAGPGQPGGHLHPRRRHDGRREELRPDRRRRRRTACSSA